MKNTLRHNPEVAAYRAVLLDEKPLVIVVTQTTETGRSIQQAHEAIRRNIQARFNLMEFVFVEHIPFWNNGLHIVEITCAGTRWICDKEVLRKASWWVKQAEKLR